MRVVTPFVLLLLLFGAGVWAQTPQPTQLPTPQRTLSPDFPYGARMPEDLVRTFSMADFPEASREVFMTVAPDLTERIFAEIHTPLEPGTIAYAYVALFPEGYPEPIPLRIGRVQVQVIADGEVVFGVESLHDTYTFTELGEAGVPILLLAAGGGVDDFPIAYFFVEDGNCEVQSNGESISPSSPAIVCP